LGKLREISYPQREDNTTFTLHYGEDSKIELDAMSNHPTMTDVDVFKEWVAVSSRWQLLASKTHQD
jgi:hypothetical protein